MLHLFHQQEIKMAYHDWDELESHGIYDLSDVLSDEEIEEKRRQKYEQEYESPISMESLGLSWRDFF